VTSSIPAPAAQAAQAHPNVFDKWLWLEPIMARRDISKGAKVLAQRLAHHHNSKTGQCNPSMPTLAAGTGSSRTAVARDLAALKEAGIIDWIQGNGTGVSNRYILKDVAIGQTKVDPAAKGSPAPKRDKGPALRLATSDGVTVPEVGPVQASGPVPEVGPYPSRKWDHPPVPEVGRKPVQSEPVKETSVSSEGPSGDSGKQTASGSQKAEGPKPKAKFTTFPDDFTLTDARIRVATSRGVGTQDVKTVFDHFREHHLAKGTRSPNWPMSWATWCRVHTIQKKAAAPKQSAV
jgi:hypothetical protein